MLRPAIATCALVVNETRSNDLNTSSTGSLVYDMAHACAGCADSSSLHTRWRTLCPTALEASGGIIAVNVEGSAAPLTSVFSINFRVSLPAFAEWKISETSESDEMVSMRGSSRRSLRTAAVSAP